MINPDFVAFYYYDYALKNYCSKMTENGEFFIENDKISSSWPAFLCFHVDTYNLKK